MNRYLARSSIPYAPRLRRAFALRAAQPESTADQHVNVGAAYPDDIEDSPLKSEILERRNRNQGIDDSYNPTMEEIYDSVRSKSPPESATAGSAQKEQAPPEQEREPEIDEL